MGIAPTSSRARPAHLEIAVHYVTVVEVLKRQ